MTDDLSPRELRQLEDWEQQEHLHEETVTEPAGAGTVRDDPRRILAALAEREGGELRVYAGDVDALPPDADVEMYRETVVTGSRPDGYQVIVIKERQAP